MPELEQNIRERAYHLWVADGRRDGNADMHWLSAQSEVLASSLGNMARVKVSDAAPDAKPAKKTKAKAVAEKNVSKKKRHAA